LTVVIDNVRNSNGVVGALLFESAEGWPESVHAAVRRKAVPAQPGRATLTFDALPPGTYAVVVLHDENENMKLDRNVFGKPREGWGMSNNPKAHFSAPPFRASTIELRRDTRIEVRLNY
jgi:uncharacterized protein (DUF2141 family)